MRKKLTALIGLATSLAMVSCYPPQTTHRSISPPPPPNQQEKVEDPTNAGLDEQRKKELEEFQRQHGLPVDGNDPNNHSGTIAGSNPNEANTTTNPNNRTAPLETLPELPPKKEVISPPDKKTYPFAIPVPGRPGFVFNPYTQAKVDVRGLPSGTLVSDPRNATQKFYVP